MERNNELRVFTKDSGFVIVDSKLQEVKWLRTEFKYDHKDDKFLYYTSRTTFQKPDGTTGTLDDYDKAFDSIEGYEDGKLAETSYKELYYNLNGGEVMHDIIHGVKRSANHEYWVFDKLCRVPAYYELEMEKFYFDYAGNRFHTDEFPKDWEIYDSKEECLSYNSYKVVKQDGTEFEREGVNKLLQLDDDQRELVKQFEDICKKMHENGVVLIADYDSICAYNTRKIENYELDCHAKPDCPYTGNAEDYEEVDRYASCFHVSHCINWYGDDQNLFILRKSTENEGE